VLVIRVMAAFSVVVVAIAATRLAIFGLIVALLVGVLGLYVWVSLALPVNLPTLLVSECRARAYVAAIDVPVTVIHVAR
jgi:hypothetical protein